MPHLVVNYEIAPLALGGIHCLANDNAVSWHSVHVNAQKYSEAAYI